MTSTTRTDAPDPRSSAKAKAAAAARKIDEYVARVVAAAPPLTGQQRATLGDLLQQF